MSASQRLSDDLSSIDRNEARLRLRDAAPDMYEALKASRQFIRNGIEYGYILMPDRDTPDSAHDTLPMIDAALAKAEAK